MPMTEEKLRLICKELEHLANTNKNRNDWHWDWVADPETFVQVDDSGVYVGKKELVAMYDRKSPTNLREEWLHPVNIYLNSVGPGLHTVMVVVKMMREKPVLEGLAKDTLHEAHLVFDDNGKFIRVALFPGDEATKQWAAALIEKMEKANGVPEGGYPEMKTKFLEFLNLDKANDLDKVAEILDDNIEYIDSHGGLSYGKAKFLQGMREGRALGYTGFDVLGPIHTPTKNSAWADGLFVFEKLPEEIVQKAGDEFYARTYIKLHPETGKIIRLASVSTSYGGSEWGRKLLVWAKSRMEKAKQANSSSIPAELLLLQQLNVKAVVQNLV